MQRVRAPYASAAIGATIATWTGRVCAATEGLIMTSFSKSEVSATSRPPTGSAALDWAVTAFGFNPDGANIRQEGVESLQQWLGKNGQEIRPDGLLGPATLAALERAYRASQVSDSRSGDPGEAAAADTLDSQSTGTGTGEAVKKAARPRKAKKTAQTKARRQTRAPDTDSGTDRETGTAEGAQEEPATGPAASAAPDAAVTARPVALSDSAIEDISQDRLGFTPYVDAVAEFVLAEQTRPPLSLVINAQWGQGKTSFMNMLDSQLKAKCRGTALRVATTWFNPWKYSEPEQVWAAFVANVTRCVRANLTPGQIWRFKRDRLIAKLRRHADFPLVLRLAVALTFLFLVLTLPFTLDLAAFHGALRGDNGLLTAFYEGTKNLSGFLWFLLFVPVALLSLLYAYVSFSKSLGLNLLEYVEKTDFRDKIGTLSQFESEMRRLADAVPDDLKIVVFIDDLDRCKGKVLGEIIEALQLADVSRTCIFVMGMDLKIVAHAIETERSELAASAGGGTAMEHGSGYKFLEKIIQARLALPSHGQAEMASLVTSAMDGQKGSATETASGTAAGKEPRPEGLVEATLNTLTGRGRERREAPRDSSAVIDAAEHYGSRHFTNPRRLKRFINGFRLQAYLASAVLPGSLQVDHLARFLVLAEKWPALLNHLVTNNKGAEFLEDEQSMGSYIAMAEKVRKLRDDDEARVMELLTGRDGDDPLAADTIQSLAAWTGFSYYPGLEKV